MKRSYAVCVAIFLMTNAVLAISCGNDDTNDDDDDGATPFDFDDTGTVDDDDDDSDDDDDIGEIDDDNAAPTIHSGEWVPEAVEPGDSGALTWKVCDVMDNLPAVGSF
ncbi:MAG: hypothetical protein IT350_17420 [Deltaproteobacteria bacterium]|nr:hypothetical protein [Deltaproteobacteria bacterium]